MKTNTKRTVKKEGKGENEMKKEELEFLNSLKDVVEQLKGLKEDFKGMSEEDEYEDDEDEGRDAHLEIIITRDGEQCGLTSKMDSISLEDAMDTISNACVHILRNLAKKVQEDGNNVSHQEMVAKFCTTVVRCEATMKDED